MLSWIFFKNLILCKKYDFLTSYSFNVEEIAQTSKVFGQCLIERLKEDLSLSKCSVGVDNATITDKNVCALKIRYLKKENKDGIAKTQLKNKVIGTKYLYGKQKQ